MLHTMRTALALVLLAAPAFAQSAAPAFEVASIRAAAPLDMAAIQAGKMPRIGMSATAGRIDIGFMSLRDLIVLAYGVKPHQVVGPDWLTQSRWDIQATLPAGATPDQGPRMLQTLLAERFKLKTHREPRELPVYELVVRDASKLKPSTEPEAAAGEPKPGDAVIGQGDQQVRISRGAGAGQVAVTTAATGTVRMTMAPGGQMQMQLARTTMPNLADMLTSMVDRPVIDRTGLAGPYQVTLEMAMGDMLNAARAAAGGMGLPIPALPAAGGGGAGVANLASDPGAASVFQSVEKLGLKLESKRAPVDTIIVDSVEKTPTEN